MNRVLQRIGHWLAGYLNQPARGPYPHPPGDIAALRKLLQPGDVLLVESDRRTSSAIKYS
ncbi:MAG: hypothetical protein WBL23_08690 [Salinisphaera sp.]|uniref:hypothetical protein n=1 Tax=Salinisphaera sp. TaxID=1914330 RepID=UPI003C7C30A8